MIKQKCKNCGGEFNTYKSAIRRGTKYCSKECFYNSRKNGVAKICKCCKKEFYVSNRDKLHIFCSIMCKKNYKGNKVTKNCLTCGKEIISLISKEKINRGNYCSNECKYKNLSILLKKRRKNIILPMVDTKIEIKIQDFLKILGIEYYSHFWVNWIKLKYQCDIFIPFMKLIIECDGDYWHGNPKIFKDNKLTDKILEQRELDKKRTKELQEKGFRVIRLWEHKIREMNLDDFQTKLNRIRR